MTTFDDLKKLDQWVCWKNENRGGKPTKVPYQVNGTYAMSNNPQTWNSYDACVRAVKVMDYDGVGFVFTSGDSYVGVDIDDCITEEGIHPKAIQIITHLNSYAEISPSETGVKIWVKDENKIADLRKKKFEIAEGMTVEIYREGRYFTVTNNVLDLSTEMVVEAGAELNEIIDMYVSKESNVFDDGEYDGIADGEDNFTESECEAYLKNQIAIATYRIKNMKDGDKHRTRYIMGRLVGGAIQAVRNAGYQVSATEHKEIIDALYEANPPSDNHGQERKAIYDGVQAGANTPTRIRKIAQNVSRETNSDEENVSRETSTQLIEQIAEYYSNTHDPLKINDLDLSHLFIHLYNNDIQYNAKTECWYEWNGNIWVSNGEKNINLAANKVGIMLEALYDYADAIVDDKARMKYKSLITGHKSNGKINGVVRVAENQREYYFDIYRSAKYKHLFPVCNGIVDLRSGELIPNDRKYGFTKWSNINYNPSATSPLFDSFINNIFLGRKELIEYVQSALGYSISGNSGHQALFFCYGQGANGKSTFFKVVSEIAGDWYEQTDINALVLKTADTNAANPYVARLKDSRVAIASEMMDGKQLDNSLIKDITGGEKLTARLLNQNPITFEPTHTLWMSGNYKPTMKQRDLGIWRRFKLIPFDYTIPEAQRRDMSVVMEELRGEYSGILNWFVQGAMRMHQDNRLPECAIIEGLTEEYRIEQDMYLAFLNECCDVNHNKKDKYWVFKKLAWDVFQRWMHDGNFNERTDRYKFARELVQRLKFTTGKRNEEFFLGLRIKPEYLKGLFDYDLKKHNGFGDEDLSTDSNEESTGFKPKIIQMPARNLPIPLDDTADDTF